MDTQDELAETTSASVSKTANGYFISLCNYGLTATDTMTIEFDQSVSRVSGQILSGQKMDQHNDFESPNEVAIKPFEQVKLGNHQIIAEIPPMSVVTLKIND